MSDGLTAEEARRLAAELDLETCRARVCQACLCIVACEIDGGDRADAERTTREVARWLWAEGLALPVRSALERARVQGLPLAERAIADVELRGARSPVVHAIVRLLAEDLVEEMGLCERGEVVPLRRDS